MMARLSVVLSGLMVALLLPAGATARVARPHAEMHAGIVKSASSTVNWPQLGFDSGHSANNPKETTIGAKNVASLQQAWSFPTGAGNNAGDVIEANGVVYAPSTNGTLYAINASTGQQMWSFASGSGYATSGSPPAYDNGLLFTVCNTSASSQGICALNAVTGSPVWTYTLPGSASYAGTPPLVSGGKLYFEACGPACEYVVADEKTGDIAWTVTGGTCDGNSGVPPSIVDNLLYVGLGCLGRENRVEAIQLKGKHTVAWSSDLAPPLGLSAAGDVVLYFTDAAFIENAWNFDATNGTNRWLRARPSKEVGFATNKAYTSMGAITKNLVYVTMASPQGSAVYRGLFALKKKNGKLVWNVGATPYGQNASWPSVANGVVYTACPGIPCAYAADTGIELWSGSGNLTFGVPIIVNGVVYGACNGTNVCAWTLPSMIRRTQRRETGG